MSVQRIQLMFAVLALVALVMAGGRSYAQMRQMDREERDMWRMERRVEALKADYDKFQLNIEVRLTKIETQLSNGFWMLSALFGVIGVYLVALIGRGAASWIHDWRASHKRGEA